MHTLHSYIFTTGRLKINIWDKSIATGLYYVYTNFEVIRTLLKKDINLGFEHLGVIHWVLYGEDL